MKSPNPAEKHESAWRSTAAIGLNLDDCVRFMERICKQRHGLVCTEHCGLWAKLLAEVVESGGSPLGDLRRRHLTYYLATTGDITNKMLANAMRFPLDAVKLKIVKLDKLGKEHFESIWYLLPREPTGNSGIVQRQMILQNVVDLSRIAVMERAVQPIQREVLDAAVRAATTLGDRRLIKTIASLGRSNGSARALYGIDNAKTLNNEVLEGLEQMTSLILEVEEQAFSKGPEEMRKLFEKFNIDVSLLPAEELDEIMGPHAGFQRARQLLARSFSRSAIVEPRGTQPETNTDMEAVIQEIDSALLREDNQGVIADSNEIQNDDEFHLAAGESLLAFESIIFATSNCFFSPSIRFSRSLRVVALE